MRRFSMHARKLYALPASVLLSAMPLHGWAEQRVLAVPTFDDVACSADGTQSAITPCIDTSFTVMVNRLDTGTATSKPACAAFFLYKELTIRQSKKSPTTLTWKIGYAGSATGAEAKFDIALNGMIFEIKRGNNAKPVSDLIDPVSVSDKTIVVRVKKLNTNRSYDHRPAVLYKDNSLPDFISCGAVDPTIGNNPN